MEFSWQDSSAKMRYTNPEIFRNLSGENLRDYASQWITATPLSSLTFYLFNPVGQTGTLHLAIDNEDNRDDIKFDIELSFVGWREFKFMYCRDLEKMPNKKTAQYLSFAPSKDLDKGFILLDNFQARRELDPRFFMPTKQTPYIKSNPFVPDMDCDVKGRIYFDKIYPEFEKITLEMPQEISSADKKILDDISSKELAKYQIKKLTKRKFD